MMLEELEHRNYSALSQDAEEVAQHPYLLIENASQPHLSLLEAVLRETFPM